LEFQHCIGQAYDGTSSFHQGHINGVVAKRFEEENNAALSVYFLAHCVNLTLQELARSIKSVKEGLSFAMDIIQLIEYSPKRQVIFETIQLSQQDTSISTSGIRTLCPTRNKVDSKDCSISSHLKQL
jgi:hypothetical protein